MRTYLVSFTKADGVSHTRTVKALTAMLAIRIAHDKVCEDDTLADTAVIACTVQPEE